MELARLYMEEKQYNLAVEQWIMLLTKSTVMKKHTSWECKSMTLPTILPAFTAFTNNAVA